MRKGDGEEKTEKEKEGQERKEERKERKRECNIENKPNNFKTMPNIYTEMLLAWADIDITHNTHSYQTILYEPIHDNPKLGNTHYTQLTKENMHLGTFGTWGRTTS